MKTGGKTSIGLLLFFLACVVGLVFSASTPFWNSFYFVREHIFIIGLLLIISDHVYESTELMLIYGIVLYKMELVIFNICLAFIPKPQWEMLSNSYNIGIWLTFSIWAILFICLIFKKWL